ncbi:unnamed protein product, partial [Tilletia caries]
MPGALPRPPHLLNATNLPTRSPLLPAQWLASRAALTRPPPLPPGALPPPPPPPGAVLPPSMIMANRVGGSGRVYARPSGGMASPAVRNTGVGMNGKPNAMGGMNGPASSRLTGLNAPGGISRIGGPSSSRSAPAAPSNDPHAAGTTLPSYEDMLVEAITALEAAGLAHPAPTSKHAGQQGVPPRVLFHWMADRYPLMKNFRPSASQALQKSLKRGRFLKIGSLYRLNPDFDESLDLMMQEDSSGAVRRPGLGDHPARPSFHGSLGGFSSSSPSPSPSPAPGGSMSPALQAATMMIPKKDTRPAPKAIGSISPAPSRYTVPSSSGASLPIRPVMAAVHPAHLAGAIGNVGGGSGGGGGAGGADSRSSGGNGASGSGLNGVPNGATTLAMLGLHHSRANPLPSAMLQAANAYTRSGTVPLPGGVPRRPPLPASYTAEQREAVEREQKAVAAKAAAAAVQAQAQAQARAQAQVQAQAQAAQAQAANEAAKAKRVGGGTPSYSSSVLRAPAPAAAAAVPPAYAASRAPAPASSQNAAQVQTELERLIALFKAKGGPAAEVDEDDEDDDEEEDDDDSEEEGVVNGPGTALALSKSVPTSGVNTTNATGTSTDAAPYNAIQSELQ